MSYGWLTWSLLGFSHISPLELDQVTNLEKKSYYKSDKR